MDSKNIKFVEIKDFFHLCGASYEIVEKFGQLIATGIIDPNNIRLITINYDTSKGNIEEGPVRIYFSNEIAVYLNLTAGYNGSGPKDLIKILELCNISFDKSYILTHQSQVNLKYCKGNDIYQFKNMDGTYEYSM